MTRERPVGVAVAGRDAECVARARAGDRDALEELFRRYHRQVSAVVARVLDHPSDVEDIVQDTFVRAFRGLASFRGEAAFSTWLCRIAINAALRRARQVQAQPALLSEMAGGSSEWEPADRANLEALVEQRASEREIRGAVAALPPKHRLVVSLRYFDGYTCEEIAVLLGCSVGTVWSRLYYAHRKLRALLSWMEGGRA